MVIDHALLDFAEAEQAIVLRLYRWSPYCLSFGRHEPALRRYGRARVEALGLDCVRRPTGGRAVWHARELTYAFAAPHRFGSLSESFTRIHRLLAAALRRLGADPVPAPRPREPPRPEAGACFASAVGGELLIEGRKVAGSAQVRTSGALLQHGALLLEDDQSLVRTLAASSGPDDGWGRFAERPPASEAPLSALLGRRVSFGEAARAICAEARALIPHWRDAPRDQILDWARNHVERYRDPAWTWAR